MMMSPESKERINDAMTALRDQQSNRVDMLKERFAWALPAHDDQSPLEKFLGEEVETTPEAVNGDPR